MKTIQKQIHDAINARFEKMEDVKSFAFSAALLTLMANPGERAAELADLIAKEKADYDAQHKVSPLKSVVFNAVTAALAQLPTEEEARETARLAVSSWLTAKGLKQFSAAQVARAQNVLLKMKDAKQDEGDMPLADIRAIAVAYANRTGDKAEKNAKGEPMKSVTDIIAHFKLAETSRQAFNLEGKALEAIAAIPEAKEEEKKEEAPIPPTSAPVPPVKSAAQVASEKNKKR